jgi:ribonuclease R
MRHRLMGERSNRIFRLGDQVTVKVVQVNLDDRKIDFELNEKSAGRGEKPAGGDKKKRKGRRRSGKRRKGK